MLMIHIRLREANVPGTFHFCGPGSDTLSESEAQECIGKCGADEGTRRLIAEARCQAEKLVSASKLASLLGPTVASPVYAKAAIMIAQLADRLEALS